MTSIRRSTGTLAVAVTAAVTMVSARQVGAQIVYPFPPYPSAIDSSVRLEVMPREAEVYVDGYYAGVVDDFDGMLQRLRVEPGQHEIAIYLDGYRTARQRLYLIRDRTFKIKLALEPLPAGDPAEPRPVPAPVPPGAPAPRPLPRDGSREPPPGTTPPAAAAQAAGVGRLTIRVQPADADVLIDGQPWPASAGQESVALDVSEGRHLIQVRKPGYVGYLTEVDVRSGETTNVDVSLRTQP